MRKTCLLLSLIVLLALCFSPPRACSDEPLSYSQLIHLGTDSLAQKKYRKALFYFDLAHLARPYSQEPLYYFNLVKRAQEGRVQVVEPTKSERAQKITLPQQNPRESAPAPAVPSSENKRPQAPAKEIVALEELTLSDELWAQQPKTHFAIELHHSVIIKGSNIEKFLMITPGFIRVDRVDRDRVKVTAVARGQTYLHIWDDHGRWTFNVEVIFLLPKEEHQKSEEDMEELHAPPFKFDYSNDWSSYYTGDSMKDLKRTSLTFIQNTSLYGETPYGVADGFATFYKFAESTEVTGYGVGLTDGHIGNFEDFSIRGFDVARRFSNLSMPGKYLRGALVTSKAFHKNLSYDLIWGQDRSTFGFVAPGVVGTRNSYVEGARVTLFPDQAHQYSANVARGYGPAREDFLKERVFSVDTKHRFNQMVSAEGEIAYDEQNFGRLAGTKFGDDHMNLGLNFRDLEKDFVTISGIPPNQGEIGGNVIFNWNTEKALVYSNLDVYRDRAFFNPQDPNSQNFEWNGSVNVPLTSVSDWRTSLSYVDTPQILSPRRDGKVDNVYSHRFKFIGDRILSTYIGDSYQKSRFALSPSSEFDRYGTMAGFSLPLVKSLSYFLNYEYSWVKETLSRDWSHPNVMNTGLGYSYKLSDSLSGNLGFSYRNEEDTEGLHSFLAGEDSISGSVGLSFHPTSDFEFFVDGRVRNIWKENESRAAYNEGDIRWGVRSSWDLPFRWNPEGYVQGTVYKDLNGNGQINKGESGLSNVKIKVGKKEVSTNERGEYKIKIKAKRVLVGISPENIPQGYVSSTPLFETVDIFNGKPQTVNFGLTTHSGVYGVVFFDQNGNGVPDETDVLVPKVKVTLDEAEKTQTDFEGAYFFNNIAPGKHTITIDVNSLPLEYLPLVRLRSEVEVAEGTTYVLHVPLKKKVEDLKK